MKKIAIITYLHTINYGAVLQAFALQNYIKSLGYNVSVLNVYRPRDFGYLKTPSDERFKPLWSFNKKSDLKSRLHRYLSKLTLKMQTIINKNKIEQYRKKFEDFLKNNVNLSKEEYRNFSSLYNNKLEYTHYITGSDQVWNYTYDYSIEPYFLTFVKEGKKISYAASIGHSNIPPKISDMYNNWLSSFDYISLREEKGKELIEGITKRKDISHVLDPTLLLSRSEWMQSFNIKEGDKKIILLYLLSTSEYSIKLAKQISCILNAPVKIITTKLSPKTSIKGVDFVKCASPVEYLEHFSQARFLITNSFHGTAFGVNFNIPLIVTTRREKRYNSRMTSLLGKSKLLNRIVYEDEVINVQDFLECDFSFSNYQLEQERMYSKSFIKTALEG